MASLAQVYVSVLPRTDGFEPELRRKLGRVDATPEGVRAGDGFGRGFVNSFKGLAVGIGGALAAAGIGRQISQAVTSASDLAETANKIQVTFGDGTAAINQFAAGAVRGLGQSQLSALNASATFGTFGKSAGLAGSDLTGFSTELVTLTSDMASFSNTTPEEAIEAVGAALRGESEPIRKYGVLLDDATLRQRALAMGLVDTTANALTPQQRVLAAHAEILAQTTAAQGDFARTSEGLANQQRIAAAQTEELRAKIGNGLMPAFSAAALVVNNHVLPGLMNLADRWMPAVNAAAADLVPSFTNLYNVLFRGDFTGRIFGLEEDAAEIGVLLTIHRVAEDTIPSVRNLYNLLFKGDFTGRIFGLEEDSGAVSALFQIRDAIRGVAVEGDNLDRARLGEVFASLLESGGKLVPVVVAFRAQMPGLVDTLSLASAGVGFFADHADTLVTLMPLLVAGIVAFKVAQAAANVAQTLSIPTKIAEVVVNRQLVASNRELIAARAGYAASTLGATGASTANTVALAANEGMTIRQRLAAVASSVAQRAVAAATALWTGAQWLLNAALTANPIGLVIVALAALGAAVVVAYQRSETFRNIVQQAWAGVQQAVSFAWNNVIRPALDALQRHLVNVVAPAITNLWRNIVEPAFAGITRAVQTAWGIIRPIFELVSAVLRTVVGPAVTFLWRNVVEPAFTGMGRAISTAWNATIRPIFDTLGSYISNNVAPAFRTGVAAIGRAWDGIQEVAKAPVRFVVNTVINGGIIDNFNRVADFFGTTKIGRLSLPRGFAAGGYTGPGAANQVAGVVHAGEHVIRAESTRAMNAAMPGLLDHINRSGRLPGYADGGKVRQLPADLEKALADAGVAGLLGNLDLESGPGIGDGIGDIFKAVSGFLTDPLGALRRAVEGVVGGVGGSEFAGMLRGVPAKLLTAAADKIRGLFGGDAGGGVGGGSGPGGWQWQMATLRAKFPGLALLSGFRPGAITSTGNPSYHGRGRAVDIPPRFDVFNWIAALYGRNTKELIFTPAGGRQLKNGSPHVFTGGTIRQDHYDHVHWAYDQGGWLPPGVSVAANNTGQAERVLGPHDEITLAPASLDRLAELVAAAMQRAVGGYDSAVGRQLAYGRMP